MTIRITLFALLAGCGLGADGNTPRTNQSTLSCHPGVVGGTVNGTIDHHAFTPVRAACAFTGDTGVANVGVLYAIELAHADDTCPLYGGGDQLEIDFCGPAAPAPGTYANDNAHDCPGNHPVATVLFADAQSEVVASGGGTVTITSDEGDCISGTFDLPFPRSTSVTDHLTGEFHALKPQ